MTDERPPVPPPPETVAVSGAAQKKGLSPMAWIAIGCGVVILLAGIAFFAAGIFFAKKAKDVVADFQENPAMAAAEMAVKLNPELDLVESDPDTQTFTVRNKETGEVVTVDLQQIQQGRITFGSGDEEVTISVEGEGEEGVVKVTGKEGETTFEARAGGEEELPVWLPIYPNAEAQGTVQAKRGQEVSGSLMLTTDASATEVLSFYERELKLQGLTVDKTTFSGPQGDGGTIIAASEDSSRWATVTVTSEEDKTAVAINYEGTP